MIPSARSQKRPEFTYLITGSLGSIFYQEYQYSSDVEGIALLETGPGLPPPVCLLPPSTGLNNPSMSAFSEFDDHPNWCSIVGELELFQFLKCVVDEVFFSENKSWNGETGVAAGFKRRGGGGLFSEQVDIIQVS